MSSLSASPFRLFEALKSSLLQLWLKAQDHGALSVGAVLGLMVLYATRYLTSPYRKLPPGPRGYPIVGNLFEMTSGQWLKFAKWHKKYGDLIYLNAAGQSVVVINSRNVAVELLDRRGAIYSDRPTNVIVDNIMSRGLLIGFARYGETWRRMRRAANEGFSKSSVKTFYETQITEAVLLASDLLVGPAQWDQHFRRASASLTLSVLYGYPTLRSEQDHVLVAIKDFADRLFKAAFTGAHLVHFFPWLRHLPSSLAKWKRDAEAWYKQDTAMFGGLLHMAEANAAKGDDHQSVAATLVREREKNRLSSIERTWFGGTMYVGGADTSSSQMAWWMLAMLAYPETQALAHAELDAVVGRARLPTFADYPHLPYIRAMVKEAMRWRPVGPLGVPHRSTEDDWYEGKFIPKGTICIANVWHMNRDPELFGKNTEHFDPGRYLDANGDIASGFSEFKEQGHFAYGFGRRNCIGRHMADNSLFINIAIMLWASKIEGKKDASGKLLPLDLDRWVDIGLVVLAKFITSRYADANVVIL
ncbi:cytochrome P450 [Russula ochroleuca]|uniref:Cytochrome P450 n=1 Tax=Russula ochroleuca TaxID=152965 RepID=A0A9P5N3M0_9AGAM|nr:cytochrome P450 [Russula ochroleuca]